MLPGRDRVTARLVELLDELDVPGAAVGIALGDSVVTASAGLLNRATSVPVTDDSLFQIGSVTKVWTATLVLQLVDEGLLDLDCPVHRYVPEFTCADDNARRVITVRQLLCHTSGVDGDFFADFGRGDDCVERYVRGMGHLPVLVAPGRVSSYSNAGYVVLGRLVERLRGCSWDDAMTRHLVAPLGLARTTTLPEQALLHRTAHGHVTDPDGGHARPADVWSLPRALGPSGLVTADVADVLAFARMHLREGLGADGGRVLSAAAVTEMQRLQAAKPDAPVGTVGGGLGWVLYDWGTPVVGHDGGTIGQSASLRLLPEHDLALAVLTNGSNGLQLAGELLRDLAAWTVEVVPPTSEVVALRPVGLPAPWAGSYSRTGTVLEVTVRDGAASITIRSSALLGGPDPKDAPQPLTVLSDNRGLTTFPGLGVSLPVAFGELDPRTGYQVVHFAGRAHRRTPDG